MRRWSIGAVLPTSRWSVAKWFPSVRQSFGDGFTNVTNLSAQDSVISQQVLEKLKMVGKIQGRQTFLLSKVSTSTAFIFSLSVVCKPSWQQLQCFDFLFAGAATATVKLLTFWKLAKKWFNYERGPFYVLLFWLGIDRQLVPLSCNQSPIIHRLVANRSQQMANLLP